MVGREMRKELEIVGYEELERVDLSFCMLYSISPYNYDISSIIVESPGRKDERNLVYRAAMIRRAITKEVEIETVWELNV